jgi:reactive intermediate/imine deaminase
VSNRIEVTSETLPPPAGPYSHGIIANGFLYTAGFGPKDAAGRTVGSTVGEQTRQTMRNILSVLSANHMDASHIVKATVHLADLSDFAEFNVAYEEFLIRPYPVRTTVGSNLANILVEIDVVAVVPK